MSKVFVRNPYNYDMDKVSEETGLFCEDCSLAVQSQAEDADINTIVARFGLTGVLPENIRLPSYGDFDQVSDFREALHAVMSAEAEFMKIPAAIRARFDHDPQNFLEFLADPANNEEAVKLGFKVKQEVPDGSAVDTGAQASGDATSAT